MHSQDTGSEPGPPLTTSKLQQYQYGRELLHAWMCSRVDQGSLLTPTPTYWAAAGPWDSFAALQAKPYRQAVLGLRESRIGAGIRALAQTGEQSGGVRTHGPGCRWPHAPRTVACAVWWQSPPCAALPSPDVLAGGSSGSRPCGRRWRDEHSPHPCCPAPRGCCDSLGSQPLTTSPRATLTQ